MTTPLGGWPLGASPFVRSLTLRCAIQSDTTARFERDMRKENVRFEVLSKAMNGTVYKVTLPAKYTRDTFAQYVEMNGGIML